MRAGVRVLLVDADLRSPGLGGLAGGGDGPGFVDVLAGGASLQDALVCSGSESLAVLPMGRSQAAAGDQSGMLRVLEGAAPGLPGQAAVSVPHRAQQLSGDERFAGRCGRIHALAQALGDGLDCLVQAQPGAQMLLGRPAGLTGDNPVGDLIVHPLAGDPA